MKLLGITLVLLVIFAFCNCRYNNSISRSKKIGVGSITLAMILKKLGAQPSIYHLAKSIEYKCGSKRLVRAWLRIALKYRKAINLSTIHPFTLRRFWYIFHKHRIVVVLLFLKTFIKCGRVLGAQNALKKDIISVLFNKGTKTKGYFKIDSKN